MHNFISEQALNKLSDMSPFSYGAKQSMFTTETVIFLIIGFWGGISIFLASKFGSAATRGRIYLACSAIFVLFITLGLVIGFWNIPGVALQTEGILYVIAFYILFVFTPILYASVRSRSYFATDGLSKGLITALVVPCLADFAFLCCKLIGETLKMPFCLDVLITLLIEVMLFVGLIVMAALAGYSLFVDGTEKMKRCLNIARKFGQIAVTALILAIIYTILQMLFNTPGSPYNSSFMKWFLYLSISTIVILIGFFLVTAIGTSDFFCQKAFKRWSKLIDVEISRMEQEIRTTQEQNASGDAVSPSPHGN
jgi:uncharacterized membrane protein YqhA